jgi:hypothetical protein
MIASGITPANNDPVALAAARCEKAGLYLLKTGRISRLCDTTSGRPGMVFYSQMEDGQTFVAQQCPIPQFISNSQRPKINAAGNLQPFEGEEPPVYDLGDRPYAPSHPVWAIAMPINLMDAFLLSDALSEVFKIKIFQPSTGQYKTYKLEDAQKFQTSDGTDLKGVGCLTPADDMPWLQLSNGQLIRADVVFSMESKSHRLLRMTHFGMVLAAVARMAFLKTGTRMKVPADLTAEDICTMGIESRLYDDDNLTVTVLSPDKSTVLGKFPAGLLHLGMHKQVPSVVSSVHPIELYEDNSYATTTETGGVVAGLMGALTMWAEGLFQCCRVLHGNPPPARAVEIAAMIQSLEYRPLPSVTEESAADEIPLTSSSSRF